MRVISLIAVIFVTLVPSTSVLGQPAATGSADTTNVQPSNQTKSTNSDTTNVQPPTQTKSTDINGVQVITWIAVLITVVSVLMTVIYTLYRGRMDARYKYASEILDFRLRQVQEFYAPALVLIEQSRGVYQKLRWTIKRERKDINLDDFRLLDHIYEFQTDPKFEPLVVRILEIGKKLTKLISTQSGLIEDGLTPTFIEYQVHFEILSAAGKQKLTSEEKQGWHELGYYPRILNRTIREGYKVVLEHLGTYTREGDKIISGLLKRKTTEIGKYRVQLLENLQFYEDHAPDYVAKFDSFDLSECRQRFIKELERTRDTRPMNFGNKMTKILDAGCGGGRDTYEFLKQGYAVTAIDASPAMLRECRKKLTSAADKSESPEMKKAAAAAANRLSEMTFDEMPFRSEFDGVWAAASLLHVPSQQIKETLLMLFRAAKPNGVIYMSFKYGRGEHERDARFYSYHSRWGIRALLRKIPEAEETDVWLSGADGKCLSSKKQRRAWRFELINRLINHYDRSLWLNVLVKRKPV